MLSVTSCENGHSDKYCDIAKIIRPTCGDISKISEPLMDQIIQNNSDYKRECGNAGTAKSNCPQ